MWVRTRSRVRCRQAHPLRGANPRATPPFPPAWDCRGSGGFDVMRGRNDEYCHWREERIGGPTGDVDRPPVDLLIRSRRYECEATENAVPGGANNFQHRDCGGIGSAYGLAAARSSVTGCLTSD